MPILIFDGILTAPTPTFMVRHEQEGIAARALEFAILIAAKTSEVLGAPWDEMESGFDGA